MSGLTTEGNCSVSFRRASYIHRDICGCQKKCEFQKTCLALSLIGIPGCYEFITRVLVLQL